jgi:hypothetical protein
MAKLDVKRDMKALYNPSRIEFSIVDVPPMKFIMLDGHGNPNNNPVYEETVGTLNALAYALKFALKPLGFEFSVAPLEGLWWMPDMNDFTVINKDRWDWTMMIMQPEQVTGDLFETTCAEVKRKKGLSMADKARLLTFGEGSSVQILYLGAYADEGPTIARMHEFIRDAGYVTNGKHHEIYLGDPRRTAPEKLKTILRQPVRKVQ